MYAAEVYNVGPTGLGILMSISGVGMVVGTLVVASLGNVYYKGKLIVGSVVTAGISMAALSLTTSYVVGLVILAALNTVQPIFYTTIQGTVQSIIPDELRGRISGLSMVTWGAFPVGSVLAGLLAENLGAQMATLIGAGILGVCLIILLRVFDFMWRWK